MINKQTVQHLKIVDNFLESPGLWRAFALDQEYAKDQSGYPGKKTKPLDDINDKLFHTLAGKIIKHTNGKEGFQRLKIQFTYSTAEEFKENNHQDEPFYNVAGVIYLNENAPLNTGTQFLDLDKQGNLIETLVIENMYNRMIIFDPKKWHAMKGSFGKDIMTGRLTITFFGIAV